MDGTRVGSVLGFSVCSLLVVALLGACEGGDDAPDTGEGGAHAGGASSGGVATGGAASHGGAKGGGGTTSLGGAGGATGGRSSGGSTSSAGADEGGAGGNDVVSTGGVSVGGANSAGSDSVSGAGGAGETGGAVGDGGIGGAGGSGGADGVPVALTEAAWDMVVTLSVPGQSGGGAFLGCPRIAFTMRTLRSGTSPGEISLYPVKDGESGSGYVVPNGFAYEMSPTREFFMPARASCANQRVVLQQVTLTALDLDGDGVADRISGSGIGLHYVGSSTVGSPISVEIKGVPDATAPYLVFPEPVHPLDLWKVFTSEQFVSLNFVLSGNPELHPALLFEDFTGGSISYSTDGRVLPFSSAWTVSGTGTDFVGLPLDPRGSLHSMDDPGAFPADGFEGTTLAAVLTGTAQRVSHVGNLAAISGQTSLLIPPGASATFHLARPSATATIRFLARSLQKAALSDLVDVSIEMGVIGTIRNPRKEPGWETMEAGEEATNDPTWPYAGPIQEVVRGSSAPGDAVLRVNGFVCSGAQCVERALLIDDLRVE